MSSLAKERNFLSTEILSKAGSKPIEDSCIAIAAVCRKKPCYFEEKRSSMGRTQSD